MIHEENDYPKGAPSCSIDNVLQQEQNHQKKELVRLATISFIHLYKSNNNKKSTQIVRCDQKVESLISGTQQTASD